GNVAASLRGDGTNPHTMEFGRLKAYTARTRGQTSQEFKTLTDKPESAYLKQIPNVVAVGGGVPVKGGNEVIGAVGGSGGPGGEKGGGWGEGGHGKGGGQLAVGERAGACSGPAHSRRALVGPAEVARRRREPVTAHRHGPPTTISVLKAPATASPVAPITTFQWGPRQRQPGGICAALPTRVAST